MPLYFGAPENLSFEHKIELISDARVLKKGKKKLCTYHFETLKHALLIFFLKHALCMVLLSALAYKY